MKVSEYRKEVMYLEKEVDRLKKERDAIKYEIINENS